MTTNERDDLRNLLTSPGWLRFHEYAMKQWTDEIAHHLRTAVNDTNDAHALQKMRQLLVAKEAIERLLAWPEERIHALDPGVTPMTFRRQGY